MANWKVGDQVSVRDLYYHRENEPVPAKIIAIGNEIAIIELLIGDSERPKEWTCNIDQIEAPLTEERKRYLSEIQVMVDDLGLVRESCVQLYEKGYRKVTD